MSRKVLQSAILPLFRAIFEPLMTEQKVIANSKLILRFPSLCELVFSMTVVSYLNMILLLETSRYSNKFVHINDPNFVNCILDFIKK